MPIYWRKVLEVKPKSKRQVSWGVVFSTQTCLSDFRHAEKIGIMETDQNNPGRPSTSTTGTNTLTCTSTSRSTTGTSSTASCSRSTMINKYDRDISPRKKINAYIG
jgi:hypothetical protein